MTFPTDSKKFHQKSERDRKSSHLFEQFWPEDSLFDEPSTTNLLQNFTSTSKHFSLKRYFNKNTQNFALFTFILPSFRCGSIINLWFDFPPGRPYNWCQLGHAMHLCRGHSACLKTVSKQKPKKGTKNAFFKRSQGKRCLKNLRSAPLHCMIIFSKTMKTVRLSAVQGTIGGGIKTQWPAQKSKRGGREGERFFPLLLWKMAAALAGSTRSPVHYLPHRTGLTVYALDVQKYLLLKT